MRHEVIRLIIINYYESRSAFQPKKEKTSKLEKNKM